MEYVGLGEAHSHSGTTLATSVPGTTAVAGDLLVLLAAISDDISIASSGFTDNVGSGTWAAAGISNAGIAVRWRVYPRFKIAVGGETTVTITTSSANYERRTMLMLFRPSGSEAFTDDVHQPHGNINTSHIDSETTPATFSLLAHSDTTSLGSVDYPKGLTIGWTFSAGSSSSGYLNLTPSADADYTTAINTPYDAGPTSSSTGEDVNWETDRWVGYWLDATSEPAETFQWVTAGGSAGSGSYFRMSFPYTGAPDPTNVSPDAYAAYDRRYAKAKALPHMLDTGWLGRQDWTGDLPEEF